MSTMNTPVPMTVSCDNEAVGMIVSSDREAVQASLVAKQTSATVVNNKSPYLYRASAAGSADMAIDKIIGGTVAWNQFVQMNSTSVNVPSGHKYLSRINGTNTIAISNGSAISINDGTKDNVFDLTAMFGSAIADYVYTLESNTAGSGIAWLKSYGFFTKPYYANNAGQLMSVKTSAHKIVGTNQMKPSNYIVGSSSNYAKGAGTTLSSGGSAASASGENPITVRSTTDWRGVTFISNRLIKGRQYSLSLTSTSSSQANKRASLYVIDESLKILSRVYNYTGTPFNTVSTTYTPNDDNVFLALSVESTTHADIFISDMMLQIGSAEYSKYEEFVYALDSDLELRGITKLDANNNLYYDGDEYASDGTVTRKYGIRAFESGDATDGSTMITDGTNTVYRLATPTTESADPYTNPQAVSADGTEEYVDERDVPIPVGHETKYVTRQTTETDFDAYPMTVTQGVEV